MADAGELWVLSAVPWQVCGRRVCLSWCLALAQTCPPGRSKAERRCRMAPAAESPAQRGCGVGGAADKAVPRKQRWCCRAWWVPMGQAHLEPERSAQHRSTAEYWEAACICPGEGVSVTPPACQQQRIAVCKVVPPRCPPVAPRDPPSLPCRACVPTARAWGCERVCPAAACTSSLPFRGA